MLIADLLESRREARLSDLAERFGVSHASASKVVSRLQKEGYVVSEPYRSLFLTEKGESLARQSKERHEIIYNFLVSLGVKPETAAFDSEGMEHHVSQETLKVFKAFTRKNKS